MTDRLDEVVLSRPPASPDAGPLDDRLYDRVEARFRRIVRDNPVVGTYVGIHTEDERLGDGSRDAVLAELDAEKAHLAEIEAIDPNQLSETGRFERDLEIHNLRRGIFDAEVVRTWERRSTALDTVGDALFLIFAQDFAPLPERLASITARLEAVPVYLAEARSRATVPQVRLWQQLEIETATDLPSFLDEIGAAAAALPKAEQARLATASTAAREALDDYRGWLEASLAGGTDEWALGAERYDALVSLRAFDGLDADGILAIGEEQLATNKAARVDAARAIDPTVDEATVVDRIKNDHPATFEEALELYREVMLRSRTHLIEHLIVTVPDDERIDVIPTPEYLRNVIPFAAYFSPPKFDPTPKGIYIVTPSVGNDPNAMREHNRSSISNTSIHEAYPGHHLQLAVANRHPSLTRLLTDAPEFVEGWGMYSEQMMREQGFDDAPNFRLAMYTDAIWRACRIILDVRMHRGELTFDEATDFLVAETSFEVANARAEVHRYTYTPTYQLSYLLGKVLLLQLRADEQRRLGGRFDLRTFHDTLFNNGSLPISFHRRLLRETLRAGGVSGSAGSRAARA
ncbi:MAG TPA: DUF885 domain-containing protein [Candidatus Limnocylindrales bacterium]|jgi:uncharacterized protein (DUF885 family)|nr:DUF885 domain-containing protein [Candidatus Limnocylindrales bacterium]